MSMKVRATNKAVVRHGLMSVQVRDALIDHFRDGGMKPGDRVLSEPEIVEQFGVGRSTAREALKLLEHDGLVEVLSLIHI